MVKFLMAICRLNFGEFEEEEFKKFFRMGLIFFVLIGMYWSIKPLKDSLFNSLVGAVYQPYAKNVSLIFMILFVAIYTKILDFIPKYKLLSFAPPVYFGSIMLAYSGFVWAFQSGNIKTGILTVVLGYFWYFFTESFSSIVITLFWSFAADITKPDSAKKGFPLIYTFGQLGGAVLPFLLIALPINIGVKSDALPIVVLSILTFAITILVRNFLKNTPSELLESVNAKNISPNYAVDKEKAGFSKGIRLLFTNRYLMSMFAFNFFFEFIVTIFDFNFKLLASQTYSGVELTGYLGLYSAYVNVFSLIFLLLGSSKITKNVGIGIALSLVPIMFALALFGFLTINSLTFFLFLMVAARSINNALSGPALKQLYIPTSKDVKSKAQAWIETFGQRFAKGSGAGMNMLYSCLKATTYRFITSGLGLTFVVLWFFIALYLGKTYKKAVDSETIVC